MPSTVNPNAAHEAWCDRAAGGEGGVVPGAVAEGLAHREHREGGVARVRDEPVLRLVLETCGPERGHVLIQI